MILCSINAMGQYGYRYRDTSDKTYSVKQTHKKTSKRTEKKTPYIKKKSSTKKHYSKKIKKKNSSRRSSKKNYKIYKVRKGDTLYKISRKFKVSVSKISSYNKLNNKNRIFKGMKLKIPKGLTAKNNKKKHTKHKKKSIVKKSPAFTWPLGHISGYKRDGINGVKSIGIIINGKPGSSVVSSAKGTVKRIGVMRGFGKYIVIKHKNRFITVYANLGRISVSCGDRVRKGTVIGNIQNRNLHFQIDYAGKPTNPLNYLPRKS